MPAEALEMCGWLRSGRYLLIVRQELKRLDSEHRPSKVCKIETGVALLDKQRGSGRLRRTEACTHPTNSFGFFLNAAGASKWRNPKACTSILHLYSSLQQYSFSKLKISGGGGYGLGVDLDLYSNAGGWTTDAQNRPYTWARIRPAAQMLSILSKMNPKKQKRDGATRRLLAANGKPKIFEMPSMWARDSENSSCHR